jgi:hypothetical protein
VSFRILDRDLWLCALLTMCIVLPRSILINRAHSPCVDDDHHLDQGLSYLRGEPHPLTYYDPPLGKMILAMPLYVIGAQVVVTPWDPNGPFTARRTVLYEQPLSIETIRTIQAAWKSLLFVPFVMVAFAWARSLGDRRAG